MKRARSFYIRKEEEARLRLQTQELAKEQQTKAFAFEQMRRLRAAEASSFDEAMAQQKGLAHHLSHFDARAQRQAIAHEMQQEAAASRTPATPAAPISQSLRSESRTASPSPGSMSPVSKADGVNRIRQRGQMARVRMRTVTTAANGGVVPVSQRVGARERVLVGPEAEAEMRKRVAARRKPRNELSLDSVLAPGTDGRTLSQKDEERIRRQVGLRAALSLPPPPTSLSLSPTPLETIRVISSTQRTTGQGMRESLYPQSIKP